MSESATPLRRKLTLHILDATDIKLPDNAENAQVVCMIQRSDKLIKFETTPASYGRGVTWKQTFVIDTNNPTESLLVLVFYSSDSGDCIPLGSTKISISQIPQEGCLDTLYDICSYSDAKIAGKLHVLTSFGELSSDSIPSESYSETSDGVKRKRRRRKLPEEVVLSEQSHSSRRREIDIDAILARAERKPKRKRLTHSEIEETGDGATVGNMLIQKKNKVIDESLQKHRIDPVKMRLFADYSVILEKNKQILSSCAKEGMMKDGIIKTPLSDATMRSLRFAIEDTKHWTETVRNMN